MAAGFAGGGHDAAGAGAAPAPTPAVTPEAPAAAPPQVTEELMRTLKVPPLLWQAGVPMMLCGVSQRVALQTPLCMEKTVHSVWEGVHSVWEGVCDNTHT